MRRVRGYTRSRIVGALLAAGVALLGAALGFGLRLWATSRTR